LLEAAEHADDITDEFARAEEGNELKGEFKRNAFLGAPLPERALPLSGS
jgi:hypothetical protein